jgi:hypothetical protein
MPKFPICEKISQCAIIRSLRFLQRPVVIAAFLFMLAIATLAANDAFAQTAVFGGVQAFVPTGPLEYSYGVAVDSAGNVYIANDGMETVLKETPTPSGTFTESTVASGFLFVRGVAVDASGNVYVLDSTANQVLKETLSGGAYSQSTVASGLNTATAIAVDGSGNVYINEEAYVLKETPSGSSYAQSQIIEGYSFNGIAVDASGNLYFSFYSGVVKGTLSGGSYSLSTISSSFGGAYGVAVDSNGIIYVADGDTAGVGRVVEEVPSNGSYTQNVLFTGALGPTGIAVDWQGNVYVTNSLPNYAPNEFLKIATAGVNFGSQAIGTPSSSISLTFTFSAGGTISAPAVLTQGVSGLDFTDAGTGTCTTNGTAHTYNAGDNCTVDVIFKPKAPGARCGAAELINGSGNVISAGYLVGTGLGPQVTFPPGSQKQLSLPGVTNPYSVAIDAAGNIYVAQAIVAYDPGNALLKETWNGSGYTETTIASGLGYPTSVAVDGAGNVYVGDQDGLTLYKETPTANGSYLQSVVEDSLGTIGSMAVDATGNVYVGRGGIGIEKETLLSNGTYSGSEIIDTIYGGAISVDSAGNLYIADGSTVGIREETPSQSGYTQSIIASGENIATLALDGLGNIYFNNFGSNSSIMKETLTGNGYVQTTLTANGPGYVSAVDASGNLYFANDQTGTVTNLDLSDAPPLAFATTAYGATSTDSPQTVTLQNNGNGALTFPVPASGNNPSIASSFELNGSASSACPIVSSGSSTAGTLAAGATCELSVSFVPAAVGAISGSLLLTDDALNAPAPNFASQSIALSGTATQATPEIGWPAPAAITYGTALSNSQLDATATYDGSAVPGTFTYTPAAGTTLTVGANQTLSVAFTPTDTADYTTATASVSLTVNQATPAINWATPAPITYGTALSSTQLDATASYGGSTVAGTYTYSSVAGTVLDAGTNQRISVTFAPTDTTDYSSATGSVVLTVNQATPQITWATPAPITFGTALSATQLDATANTQGTFGYSPALGTVLSPGSQVINVTFAPANGTDYTLATASVTVAVNKATPVSVLTSSANPAYLSDPVTFTATVSAASGIPTGTVSFYDGTTLLGPASLTSGVATYATSGLAAGMHSITAVYAGDSDFTTVTSSVLTETVENFTIGVGSGGTSTATTEPGGQAVFSFTVSPPSGEMFAGPITFTVTGLPPGAAATFSPATVPAGAGATTVTMTVTVPNTAGLQPLRRPFSGGALPMALGLVLLPFAGMRRRLSSKLKGVVCLLVLGIAGAALVTGCGGNDGKSTPPPQNYTLAITGTSGSLSNTFNVTLTVE